MGLRRAQALVRRAAGPARRPHTSPSGNRKVKRKGETLARRGPWRCGGDRGAPCEARRANLCPAEQVSDGGCLQRRLPLRLLRPRGNEATGRLWRRQAFWFDYFQSRQIFFWGRGCGKGCIRLGIYAPVALCTLVLQTRHAQPPGQTRHIITL